MIMTFDCNKIQLKQGSKGGDVKELQAILTSMKLYDGKIDGDYGEVTADAVQKLQARLGGLLVDGVFGKQTCTKLREYQNKDKDNGIYTSSPHWTGKGCNKLGQCTPYYCGVHSIRQCNAKQDIDAYLESQLAQWAGTTTSGTSHGGLETCVAMVARRTGRKIGVEWMNFSDLGSSSRERWQALGRIIQQKNKTCIIHNLYRNKYGHYEVPTEINLNNSTVTVLNSLGSRCGGSSYCGYLEYRKFSEMESYMRGISQKSIMILTYN